MLARESPREEHGSGAERDEGEVYPASELMNLVVVAGHAIFVGPDFKELETTSSWILEDYQKMPGMIETFIDHIRIGVETAASDPKSMLLFSGTISKVSH